MFFSYCISSIAFIALAFIFLLAFVLVLTFTEELSFMGKPKKHQSADATAGEVNLETKDEGELVSIATVKKKT